MKKVKEYSLLSLFVLICAIFCIPLMILAIIDDVREDHFYDDRRKAEAKRAEYYHRYG